jgi:hypothetical protein
MRREIPLLITAVLGIFVVLSFFIPHPWVQDTTEDLRKWFVIIAAFAFVLGMGNLIRVNVHRVKRRGEDWPYKLVTLLALAIYLVLGLVLATDSGIRKSWLTRSLGIVEVNRQEVLIGQSRLFDRREEVAAIMEGAAPGEVETALRAAYALDDRIANGIPALVTLGADGVRALDAREVHRQLRAEQDSKEPWQRRMDGLIAQRAVAGFQPLVEDVLANADDPVFDLRANPEFTLEQAEDLVALGATGIAALDSAAIDGELTELAAVVPEDKVRNPANWVFKYMYSPLQATMFSLLAFFIASAAFRAFRMRTFEAGLLLGAGLLVMFGRVPLGQFDLGIASDEFSFLTVMNWIMAVPTTAAQRGIMMGAAMGVIVMGLKVILGIERSYLGGD